jgi:hypothetical protein
MTTPEAVLEAIPEPIEEPIEDPIEDPEDPDPPSNTGGTTAVIASHMTR